MVEHWSLDLAQMQPVLKRLTTGLSSSYTRNNKHPLEIYLYTLLISDVSTPSCIGRNMYSKLEITL